jgi:hypothetical protein
MNATIVVAALLLVCAIGGCAGPLHLGALPTDEERCRFVGGVFHSGLCDYCL